MRKLLLIAAILAIPAAIAFGASRKAPEFNGTAYLPPEPAPAFELTTHEGTTAKMQDYRGAPVLLFFGFTHCPDVCPLTLSKLSRVAGDTKVLLVTVDPERDTPGVLAEYVNRFGGNITGLTGTPEELARLRDEYGVHAGAATESHGMTHTAAVFGIDSAGQIRVLLRPDQSDELMAEDIRALAEL